MKKTVLLCLALIIVLCGCLGNSIDAPNADDAYLAVNEYLRCKEFIVISDEHIHDCIKLVEYDSDKEKYKFEINYNPFELFPESYEDDDNVQIYKNTLFVVKKEQIYNVVSKENEYLFTYYS